MAQNFKETAHLNTDHKSYTENYSKIDWGPLKQFIGERMGEKSEDEKVSSSDQGWDKKEDDK